MDRHIPLPVSTLVYANLTMKRAGCCPKAYPHISVVGLILQIKLVQNEHGPSGRSYPLTLESFDPCRQSFVTSVAIRSTCSYFLHFCLTLPALPFCPLGAAGLLAEERTMENGKWKMENGKWNSWKGPCHQCHYCHSANMYPYRVRSMAALIVEPAGINLRQLGWWMMEPSESIH